MGFTAFERLSPFSPNTFRKRWASLEGLAKNMSHSVRKCQRITLDIITVASHVLGCSGFVQPHNLHSSSDEW
eukprot:412914-Amphidinium_carterae.1